MKSFKEFIFENENLLTLYHGTNVSGVEEFSKLKHEFFLSTDLDFSKDYGTYIYQVTIKPQKIFDSTSDLEKNELINDMKNLLKTESEKTSHWNYDKIYFYEEMIKKITNNSTWSTWYWIEAIFNDNWKHDYGLGVDYFNKKGYDAILITETGIKNYMIWLDDVILNFKFLGKKENL
jgi:hypothetical protein